MRPHSTAVSGLAFVPVPLGPTSRENILLLFIKYEFCVSENTVQELEYKSRSSAGWPSTTFSLQEDGMALWTLHCRDFSTPRASVPLTTACEAPQAAGSAGGCEQPWGQPAHPLIETISGGEKKKPHQVVIKSYECLRTQRMCSDEIYG